MPPPWCRAARDHRRAGAAHDASERRPDVGGQVGGPEPAVPCWSRVGKSRSSAFSQARRSRQRVVGALHGASGGVGRRGGQRRGRSSYPHDQVFRNQRSAAGQRRRVGTRFTAVMRISHVLAIRFGVIDDDVEVAIVGEMPCDQLELGIHLAAAAILFPSASGRKLACGTCRASMYEWSASSRGRSSILESSPWLHSLPVRPNSAFEDRVAPVPQRQREAEILGGVADTAQPVCSSGRRARRGRAESSPRPAVGAVVLAHCAPARSLR